MKYEFNIEHNTIFTIKIFKRWVINSSIISINKQNYKNNYLYLTLGVLCNCAFFEHNSYKPIFIFRLPWYIKYWWTAWSEVYPVFQDLCTPVWGKANCFFFIVLLIDANYAILTKYSSSTNDVYTCSWFSWTFTNIKQVVLHVK
jgi:hypothetical protein